MRLKYLPFLAVFMFTMASANNLSADALTLDGNGDYVTFPGTGIPSGNSHFTIEIWINPTTIPTGGANGGQMTFWGNQSGNQANGFRLRGATGTRHYFWGNDHDEILTMNILPDTTGPNADGWHHFAITWNGIQTQWYWNGQPLGPPRTATPGVNVAPVNHRIGSRLNEEFFHGFVDELRIWDKARSAAEIAGDFELGLNGSEPNLVAYFDFEGNLEDRAGANNNGTPVGNASIAAGVTAPVQTSGPRITSFNADPVPAYEDDTLTFSWTIDDADVVGSLTVEILDGSGSVIHTTAASSGSHPILVGDTGGVAETVTYRLRASDSGGDMVVREDTVEVVFDPGIPVANPQSSLLVNHTNALSITLTGSDPNNGPNASLSYTVLALPAHGTLSGSAPNLVYTATQGYAGFDEFTFNVNDGKYDSPDATVTMDVLAPPVAPSDILLSAAAIDVTTMAGNSLGVLKAVDLNPQDAHTYTLVPGFGDNNLFSISGDRLIAQTSFDTLLGSVFSIRVEALDSGGLSFAKTFVLQVIEVNDGLVINEVHYDPMDNTVFEQFIEIFNASQAAFDLEGWRLSGAVDFQFPSGTVVEAGGYVVVARDPAVLLSRHGVVALGPWIGQLNNEGEQINLRNLLDQRADQVDYRSEFPWPIASNGEGGSMQLINPKLDNDLGSSWKALAAGPGVTALTPGAPNSVFQENAAPNIRQVKHAPQEPTALDPVVITAKVTDPDFVDEVILHYQVVEPGNYLPAIIPLSVAQLNSLNTTPLEPSPNPAFEDPANWVSIVMVDNGLEGDVLAGDDIYSVTLPPQINRTLVRYRITVTDVPGASRRAPFADDPSLNFAYYVYNGVPDYQGTTAADLTSLPVYTMVTRAEDVVACTAYTGGQLPQTISGVANEGRFAFNWPSTMVYDGVVYDNIRFRLRGANGRYQPGKRNFRLTFNKGNYLQARDQNGKKLPAKWSKLNTGKGQSNRETLTFGLNEVINYFLFETVGVPSPRSFFFHFRVVDGAEENPAPYTGDFWGMNWAQENYDVRFLEAHDLPKGNLYKLINSKRQGWQQQRYQAPFAVINNADHDNIEANLVGNSTAAWIQAHVNVAKWYRYHAICEAARNYDFWPSANKNAGWYFEPIYTPENNFLGRMMTLPWDSDSSWGPTWNSGHDVVYNSIFPAGGGGSDGNQTPELQPGYRNSVREVRDLLFQEDQINAIIDAFAAQIEVFVPADLDRWASAPSSQGSYNSLSSPGPALSGGLPAYVADMKKFAFEGGSWPGGSVAAGGQVLRLDQVAADNAIPVTPTIAYAGAPGFPIDGIVLQSTPFDDPQGAGTFGAIRWRVAEINAPGELIRSPADLKLEWHAAWDSGELPSFNNQVQVPAFAVEAGKFYRARVQHKDNSGRWSHWSNPIILVPSPADVVGVLQRNLVVTEIHYNPLPGPGIDAAEYEFLELKNKGTVALDLGGLFFSDGINYSFPAGTTLAAGDVFLLARNPLVFATRYPGVTVDGDYSGKLENDGETITISHPHGAKVLTVTYNDRAPWQVSPDGFGFSLVLLDPGVSLNNPRNWRASTQAGGSPGSEDPASPVSRGNVVINEILTSSTLPDLDAIELFNPTSEPINIGGWFLTDQAVIPQKYIIPSDTILVPGGFLSFNETLLNSGAPGSFLLSSLGEQVYLFSADGSGNLTGYSHGFSFGAAADGVAFGRYVISTGEQQYPAQTALSLDDVNPGPIVGPIVISEIMYHPPDIVTSSNVLNDSLNEYVELRNISTDQVVLLDPFHPTNTWQLRGGVDFVFPQGQIIEGLENFLLVAFDPVLEPDLASAFRLKYGIAPTVRLFGPFSGNLNNAGETVRLLRPEPPLVAPSPNAGAVPMVEVDRLDFSDEIPWPVAADGLGASLQRLDLAAYGNDPVNWIAALPNGGSDRPGGVPPVITEQPMGQNVSAGSLVMLNVNVSGSNLRYQWQLDGNDLPGQTGPVLTLSDVQPVDSGNYRVVVFNQAGSDLSQTAPLNVGAPPVIIEHPLSFVIDAGDGFTNRVTASGLPPLQYQWFLNGQPIPGETAHTLVRLSGAGPDDIGSYTVRVGSPNGSILSRPGDLLVLIRPLVLLRPLSQSVVEGGSFTLSIEVEGTLPMGFRWRRGSITVTNSVIYSTTDFLTINNVTMDDAGPYSVVLTNRAFSTPGVLSPRATITVLTDSDGDRMSDTYETANGLNPNNAADKDGDVDADGMTNYEESVAGTDPNDENSYLKVETLALTGEAEIVFEAKPLITYSIETASSLSPANWQPVASVVATGTGGVQTVRIPATGNKAYYRLVTPRQP